MWSSRAAMRKGATEHAQVGARVGRSLPLGSPAELAGERFLVDDGRFRRRVFPPGC